MAKQTITQLKSSIRQSNPGRGAGQRRGYKSSLENIVDSTNETIVATLTSVSESAIISTTTTLPSDSVITDITAIATSAFSMDSGLYALNIGTASLGATGFTAANILNGEKLQFMAVAATEIAVGTGVSTTGATSNQLGSTITSSLQVGNIYYADETPLYLQLSSSGATTFFDTDTGVMKVAISYKKLS